LRDFKLIYALSHLNVYELNKFKKFVKSPYFNLNQTFVDYVLILEKYVRNPKKKLDREKVFVEIFSEEIYSDKKFRKLNTDCLSLFEEFLAVENYSNKKLAKTNHLLSELRERRLEKLYNSILSKSRRYSEQSFSKTSEFYYQQYSLQKNIFSLTSEFERKAKSKDKLSNFNVPEISYNLDLFYIIEKLRYMCKILSWQSVRNQKVQINFIDEIVQIVENSALLRNRVVEIYYQIYMTHVNEEDPKHYFKLKELIEDYLDVFPLIEAKEIFEAAFTYGIRRVNKGDTKFQSEVLDLYKYALTTELLLTDSFLSPTTFRNITMSSLRLGEFDWTNEFIKSYSNKLNPKFADSVINYNKALLSFYRKEYQKVIEYLVSFEYDEVNYSLGAKNLLLSTYYELDEFEALHSLLNSFNVYINRNSRIIDRVKKAYKNLIQFTRKLSKAKYQDKKSIEKLKKQIEETELLFSKQWLLSKVNEVL